MATEGVQYTVKELLAVQNDKLDRIERKVDEGAQRQAEAIGGLSTRVALLEQKEDLEPRVRELEGARKEVEGERGYRRFLWPSLWGVLVAAAGWLPSLHYHP